MEANCISELGGRGNSSYVVTGHAGGSVDDPLVWVRTRRKRETTTLLEGNDVFDELAACGGVGDGVVQDDTATVVVAVQSW